MTMKGSEAGEMEHDRGTKSVGPLGLTFWTFNPFFVSPEFI